MRMQFWEMLNYLEALLLTFLEANIDSFLLACLGPAMRY
jgi:hypothetical protein